jgi:phage shock protein A
MLMFGAGGVVVSELAEVRERLARLEARAEAHEDAGVERHERVLAALTAVQTRLEQVDARAWKLTVALALSAGGVAGGAELVSRLLGG